MFHGSIPALVTPFRGGVVDRDAFVALVERQIEAGSTALVPCGTTGESATLSYEERCSVIELCVTAAAGRVPVIAGAGSNATHEAIALVRHAKTVGADAALVVCPYYNKPDQAGLEAHFRAINDVVCLPVLIYNVPARTACDLQPETVAKLARLPNIVGIKDASADMARVCLYASLTQGQQFEQLSGDDLSALSHLCLGGRACISVTANVEPELCADMHAAFNAGNMPKARAMAMRLARLHAAMFLSPSPGPAKYFLMKMGLCREDVRLPILPPDDTIRPVLDDALTFARSGGNT